MADSPQGFYRNITLHDVQLASAWDGSKDLATPIGCQTSEAARQPFRWRGGFGALALRRQLKHAM